MIPSPRRSVTRFFIPLIDVLTLLFCIFLLMPYVKSDEDESRDSPKHDRGDAEQTLSVRERALRDQWICVLEIEADSGKLYQRGIRREEIADQAAAFALIDREQRAAPGKDVYFLMLYPRELTGFPQERQIGAYERWFAAVPHGFDRRMSIVRPPHSEKGEP